MGASHPLAPPRSRPSTSPAPARSRSPTADGPCAGLARPVRSASEGSGAGSPAVPGRPCRLPGQPSFTGGGRDGNARQTLCLRSGSTSPRGWRQLRPRPSVQGGVGGSSSASAGWCPAPLHRPRLRETPCGWSRWGHSGGPGLFGPPRPAMQKVSLFLPCKPANGFRAPLPPCCTRINIYLSIYHLSIISLSTCTYHISTSIHPSVIVYALRSISTRTHDSVLMSDVLAKMR